MNKDSVKGLALGVIIGMLIMGNGAYAADGVKKKIEMMDLGIKVFHEGTQVIFKDQANKKVQPLVSGGVVYVPITVLKEVMKKDVTYDAKNHKVDIGMVTLPNGNIGVVAAINKFGFLDDDIYVDNRTSKHEATTGLPSMKEAFTVGGVRYMATNALHDAGHTELKGTFKRMTGKFAIADWMPKTTKGTLRLIADDKVVFDKTIQYGDSVVNVDLDLRNVNKLRFENSLSTEFFNIEFTPVWKTTEVSP